MTDIKPGKPTSLEDQHLTGDMARAGRPVTRTPDTTEKDQRHPQTSLLESVGHLVRAVYAGTFKRTTLKRAELAAIQSGPSLSVSEKDELNILALSDRTLGRTRSLMLIGAALDGKELGCEILEFTRQVLQNHPAFSAGLLAGVLENLPEAVKEDRAVKFITSQDYASLPWSESSKPMTKREHKQCSANALHCLLLLFWVKRRTSIERIHHHLQTILWAPAARGCKTETEKFRALITAQDSVVAAITYGLLEKQTLEQSQRAEDACRDKERAAAQASELKEEFADVEARRASTQEKLDQLTKELQEVIQAHENAKAHWKDDYEQLRGQVLRRLNDELPLLVDGLHALRRDPPKVHIMIDHAERAIEGLESEVKRLRGKG